MPSGATNSGEPIDGEALLVQQAKERSPDARAQIYDGSYPKLYRYCYARTSNDGAASELASRVFLEALEGIDKYQYRGRPLLAWLYRIARNIVSDHLQKRQRESLAMEEAGALLDGANHGPPIDDRFDIEVALRQLTDDQQQLIVLRYYAGFSTSEIAQAMDRSERAVYSMEVRALTAVRKLMAPEGVASGRRHVA
jgi:RNA polymerase sigma-70 factor, ECF subfamily